MNLYDSSSLHLSSVICHDGTGSSSLRVGCSAYSPGPPRCGLRSRAAQASWPHNMWALISQIRNGARVPCVGRHILNPWVTKEVSYLWIFFDDNQSDWYEMIPRFEFSFAFL